MPTYAYTARDASGQRTTAVADAPSLPALAAQLHSEGATIERAQLARKQVPPVRGVPYFDVLAVYRQIASAIQAGMPIKETLGMLSREARNPKLRTLLRALETEVAEGVQLSDAMALYPAIFPRVHVAVVRAGEESERLATILNELAEQAETLANMNRRFASALVYPVVVGGFALLLLNFALAFVVPKFRDLFLDLGIRSLPWATQVVFFIGRFIAPATVLLLGAVMLLVALILVQRRAASGRLLLDTWKLRIPLVGQIVEKAALARFAGTLGLLLDAGIELPRALDIAAASAGNGAIELVLRNVAVEVERGSTLSDSIDANQAMPPTIAWQIGAAEEGGALPESLVRVGKLYAAQVDSLVTALAGFIEPILIIVVGSGVFMLVIGMLLPLAAVIQSLAGGGM